MKHIITIALAFIVSTGVAQTPKPRKVIIKDTVKTISEVVKYLPDTIPVYFKEVGITTKEKFQQMPGPMALGTLVGDSIIYERWNKGYVIWQTYKQYSNTVTYYNSNNITLASYNNTDYYVDKYTPTQSAPGKFLYEDKKPVTNLVLISILRK